MKPAFMPFLVSLVVALTAVGARTAHAQAPAGGSDVAESQRTSGREPAWTRVNPLSTTDAGASLAWDTTLPAVAYLGTYELFTSWSTGQRFYRTLAARADVYHPYRLFAVQNAPGTAYASEQVTYRDDPGALLVTHDAGLSWREVGRSPALLAIAPDDPNVRWALARTLVKTVDGGATWDEPTFGCFVCSAIVPIAANEIYVLEAEVLYHSFEGDPRDDIVSTPEAMMLSETPSALAVARRRPEVVYVGSANMTEDALTGLRKSLDGGATWIIPSEQFAARGVAALALGEVDGRLYLAASHGDVAAPLFVSTDGGQTFDAASSGLEGLTVHRIVPHPRLPCVAFASTNQGLFRTTSGGGSCRRR